MNRDCVATIDLRLTKFGKCIALKPHSFARGIAITPDQAPVAALSVVPTVAVTATHVYAGTGHYRASVIETDSAGTSTTRVFTGQTLLRNGGPSARTTVPVVIP